MTPRIQELAQQANAWYPMGYPSGEGGDAAWQNLVIFEKEDLEKFAELIIRECVSICKEKERPNLYGVREVEASIKEHFGVKECQKN